MWRKNGGLYSDIRSMTVTPQPSNLSTSTKALGVSDKAILQVISGHGVDATRADHVKQGRKPVRANLTGAVQGDLAGIDQIKQGQGRRGMCRKRHPDLDVTAHFAKGFQRIDECLV